MCFRKVVQTSVWVSEKSYWEHGDFSWNLEKTRTHGFFKGQKIALVLRTRVIVRSLKKLTCACFFQLALETMLLPTQIRVAYIVYWMETQETFSTNNVCCCFNKSFFCMAILAFVWRGDVSKANRQLANLCTIVFHKGFFWRQYFERRSRQGDRRYWACPTAWSNVYERKEGSGSTADDSVQFGWKKIIRDDLFIQRLGQTVLSRNGKVRLGRE